MQSLRQSSEDRIVISPKFDLAEDFSDGMARIAINASWSFIDKNGDIVIKPRFQHVKNFVGGLARVITEAGVGYIDKTGRYVWDPTR
jgi:hypothetical protein